MSVTPARINEIGLERSDYQGYPTTLCKGCGHNSISNQIIAIAYELALEPWSVIKMSGIGCSSKSPAYFLNLSHGFNALHGRMPSVTTGATLANHALKAIAVSGDGDTGSIGMGQFKNIMRRNVPMVYIIENNGVYGLTKGQFSATADNGLKLKYAGTQKLPAVDLCMEALVSDATFIARSFAGDAKQVRELLKAAIHHNGTAILDIISPCVTFNNEDTSPKSYGYGKEHEEPIQEITFVPYRDEIQVDYSPGEEQLVQMHDGSFIKLKKLSSTEHDPTDRMAAIHLLERVRQDNVFLTGLIYVDPNRPAFDEIMEVVDTPLAWLPEEQVRPSREAFNKVMAGVFSA
jgi:2-oxoglutarate/2-oxoacid ferredoxin oxidoreductase subunit beta